MRAKDAHLVGNENAVCLFWPESKARIGNDYVNTVFFDHGFQCEVLTPNALKKRRAAPKEVPAHIAIFWVGDLHEWDIDVF